jgi:hypothetical protein
VNGCSQHMFRWTVLLEVATCGNIGDARITGRGVTLVVKTLAELAGVNPSEASGH